MRGEDEEDTAQRVRTTEAEDDGKVTVLSYVFGSNLPYM